jgi:ABC-2 type transport system ATP-binding protein
MSTDQNIIETRDLTKRYGDFCAVDAVSFSLRKAEIFGLIGPNGAGKSTLVKMLTTLLPPSSGTAEVDGFDIKRQPGEVRRHIGYVPQLLSADGNLTGYENLQLSARLYLLPAREREARIAEALAMMELSDVKDRLVSAYSGGMIRRLEIAQSMLHQPAVLFMDEPTVGLDPVARNAVWDHVEELCEKLGTTILITTHMMEEADALCDRIGLLHAGKLQEVGTPQELKDRVGPGASLDDVFAHITGAEIDSGGSYRDTQRTRRSIRAHG